MTVGCAPDSAMRFALRTRDQISDSIVGQVNHRHVSTCVLQPCMRLRCREPELSATQRQRPTSTRSDTLIISECMNRLCGRWRIVRRGPDVGTNSPQVEMLCFIYAS